MRADVVRRHAHDLDGFTFLERRDDVVVLGKFNRSEIIRFVEVMKGLANPMLSLLCLFLSTMVIGFSFASCSPSRESGPCGTRSVCYDAPPRNGPS
jgi:hypothetical protein